MAAITFSLETMPFATNLLTSEEWTQVGYAELAATTEITAGDYSEIFYAIMGILFGANNDKYPIDELFSEIFSVKSSETETGRRLVEGIYGGRIKRKDDQLLLIFGDRQFPIIQDGEVLTCGNVTGRLTSTPKKDINDKQYYVLEWSPKASYNDKSFRYIIPIAIAKVDDKFPSMDLDRLDEIAAKNNLIDWVEVVGAGGEYYKAYQLFDGVGIQSFKVVDVSVTPTTNPKYKDNVVFTLADGRKANANSQAQLYFIELNNQKKDLKVTIPFEWIINKYENEKCSSSIRSLTTEKIGSTKIPSFANLIGGSSLDFEKLSESQTKVAVAPVAVIEPSKSANDPDTDYDDIPY